MATIQERLQMKRVPIDKWSTREQLCLASAVLRSGDQNWMSVSRSLKQYAEPNRPADWFSQKNCAAQYGSMLENVETPKRKKRTSGPENATDTPGESIVRKLTQERKAELLAIMEEEKREYLKLKEEMELIRSGKLTDTQVVKMCEEIDEEEKQKEQDALAHTQWLKSREERKLKMEQAFRPVANKVPQKRKASDAEPESTVTDESTALMTITESPKPALSPLLTSLLKSPTHAPNAASGLLHSVINQRGSSSSTASPTIASLLKSAAPVPVSASLQQLVTTAITVPPPPPSQPQPQQPPDVVPDLATEVKEPPQQVIVKEDCVEEVVEAQVIKEEPDANEKEEQDEEVDEEEVELQSTPASVPAEVKEEVVKSSEDSIETTVTESSDPAESHPDVIQEEVEAEEEEDMEETETKTVVEEPGLISHKGAEGDEATEESSRDQYTFDSDSNSKTDSAETKDVTEPLKKEGDEEEEMEEEEEEEEEVETVELSKSSSGAIKQEVVDVHNKEKEFPPGSVEIVEVVVMEDEDSDKEKQQSEPMKSDVIETAKDMLIHNETVYSKGAVAKTEAATKSKDTSVYDEYDFDDKEERREEPIAVGKDTPYAMQDAFRKSTFTPEYTEAFFDDMAIEVTKMDKSGKAKRDYSRTSKKKEDKDLDILLAVEKAVSASLEERELLLGDETGDSSQESDKNPETEEKKAIPMGGISNVTMSNITANNIKNEERSNSPWTTEEEEPMMAKARRRLSTPATPSDSVPGSPSDMHHQTDEDREHRTWKKSVMYVYNRLAAHKYASLFFKPITDEQAPGYHGIVHRPMDLQTIRRNVENGHIRTTAHFQRDVLLMLNNAIMYNKTDEHVYNMACEMQREGLQQIHILLQVQTHMETPARRETRTSESGLLKRKRTNVEEPPRPKKRRDD